MTVPSTSEKSGFPETCHSKDTLTQSHQNEGNQPPLLRQHITVLPSAKVHTASPAPQPSDPPMTRRIEKLTQKHKLLLVQDDELFRLEDIFASHCWDSEDAPAEIHNLLP